MRNCIAYNNFLLTFQVFGNGENVILAFHGYGRSANDFAPFEKHLGKDYTIYSFNLFHHSDSFYPKERIKTNQLSKEELKSLFEVFFQEKKIQTFSLFGYSIGGRFAFCLLEFFPDKIKNVKLFAPDGLKPNYAVNFLNNTLLGQYFYRIYIKYGNFFVKVVAILQNLNILSDKLSKFIYLHSNTYYKRVLLYKVWMSFNNIKPNYKLLAQEIKKHEIPVDLFIGKYDTIILPESGERFIRKMGTKTVYLHFPSGGHNILTDKFIKENRAQLIK